VSQAQKHNLFFHFQSAGCTDLTQLIEAGLGLAIKTYMKHFCEECLSQKTGGISTIDSVKRMEKNGNHITALERWVLYTHLLAKAWTKLGVRVDCYKVASKVGNNLATDGSRDNLVKMERFENTYSFQDDDAAWGGTKDHPHFTMKEAATAMPSARRNAWRPVRDFLEGELFDGEVTLDAASGAGSSKSSGQRGG
jgi:hypothetical protein